MQHSPINAPGVNEGRSQVYGENTKLLSKDCKNRPEGKNNATENTLTANDIVEDQVLEIQLCFKTDRMQDRNSVNL